MFGGVYSTFAEPIYSYANLGILSAVSTKYPNSCAAESYKSNSYQIPDTNIVSPRSIPDSLALDSNYLPRTKSAIKTQIKYNAKDSIVYDSEAKTAALYSDAQINYEDYDMKSARIIINLEKKLINATGEKDSAGNLSNTPVFKQGADEYKIEEVTFNYESKRGLMRAFRTQEGDGFIKGERVKRDEFNNFYIRESYYTTCDLDHPHFSIKAKKLKVIPGEKVITGPANLTIGGMPTPLVLPFGLFHSVHFWYMFKRKRC
jgi:lipopolysaccharide assembly outer membrane protein LptD (OstA)